MGSYFDPQKRYLNGWWDFLPIYAGEPGSDPPPDGWLEGALLVPSVWGKSGVAWRRPGETHFQSGHPPADAGEVEYFCDAFGYPPEWDATRTGWLRRRFAAAVPPAGKRLLLCFEAAGPCAEFYVNGTRIGSHADPFLPVELDITGQVRDGENEVAVLIRPYPVHRGRTLVPSGNELTHQLAGIWQDCYLAERGVQRVALAKIRTSTRRGHISAAVSVQNAEPADAEVTLSASVHPWLPGGGAGGSALAFAEKTVALAPNGLREVSWGQDWKDARWWDPADPQLYWLMVEVRRGGKVIDRFRERFGFREVWINGPDLMLNDHPIHLASDWGHKAGLWNYTEAWVRKWMGMIRDANMNHSRLHTHPHPRLVMDLADELGILITGETAIHGSGNCQAADHPDYWQAAREHLRAFIARDCNRPSVILWSIENEMRFEREGKEATHRELPLLRALAQELDPTRIAYHEGDSMMWEESDQPLMSRHYGRLCSGLGWWDRQRPLLSGEMSLHHLNGPNVVIPQLGDEGWADYEKVTTAASEDARLVIEAGRTIGVAGFGPWNLSALDNYRRETAETRLEWPDWSAPGIKPLRVPPYSAEFAFWKPGPGYSPSPGFAVLAGAFRPVALIDLSMRTRHLCGREMRRTLHLVNDSPRHLRGEVTARLKRGAQLLAEQRWPVEVPRGRRIAVEWTVQLPAGAGEIICEAEATGGSGATLDRWQRVLHLSDDLFQKPAPPSGIRLALAGGPELQAALETLGYDVAPADSPAAASALGARIFVAGPNTAPAKFAWLPEMRDFLAAGGRVVLLEQKHACLTGCEFHDKPVSAAFARIPSHPLLAGITSADLAYWGGDAYAQLDPDHRIASRLYRKDDGSALLPVIDTGEGSFGDGDLEYAALLESAEPGGGLLIACQLEIGRHLHDIPAAQRLLQNIAARAAQWRPPDAHAPTHAAEASPSATPAECVARARAGETILAPPLTPATIHAWAEATGLPLALHDAGEIYQLVRAQDDSILAGITQADLCGLDNWIYGPATTPEPVAAHALAPCAGLEALLLTPARSLLREFFVHHGRTEFLRAHTASRFLFEELPRPGIGLARLRIGAGEIIFWQFTAGDAARVRCGRAQRLLRRNLRLAAPSSLLADEPPAGSEGSPGYPEQLWVLAQDLTEAEIHALQDSTVRNGETGPPSKTLRLRGWRLLHCPEGSVRAADCGHGSPILLYTRLRSPRRRSSSDADLGIPNPNTFTHCELTGDGIVQMTMDAYRFPPLDLAAGGSGVVRDMAMDLGYNQSLLAWWPASPDSRLTMRWKNSLLQPETSFGFV